MKPAWSVILLTTLIGAAQGLFLIVLLLDAFRSPPKEFVLLSCGVSLVLLVCGLAASFFHLGHLVEYGQTLQIFENPKNPETEAYISGRFS